MALYSTFTDAIHSYLGLSPTAFFTILSLMVGAYLLVSSFFVSPDAAAPAASEAKNRSAPPPPVQPVAVPAQPVQLGDVTLDELKAFDGSDPKKPLLMAIKGNIYDVSMGRYGS